MKEILLCKCGELVLKGLNRRKFEDRLQKTLYWRLKKVGNFKVHGCQSTFYVEPLDENASMDEAMEVCRRVFGLVGVCRAVVCEKDIRDIKEKFNLTIFLIEHHMDLVMKISDRIYVLDFGKQIASGTPTEIQNNPRVIEAYLGVADDAEN